MKLFGFMPYFMVHIENNVPVLKATLTIKGFFFWKKYELNQILSFGVLIYFYFFGGIIIFKIDQASMICCVTGMLGSQLDTLLVDWKSLVC